MALTYRKRNKGRDLLHWNSNCHFWPKSDFEELYIGDPEEQGYDLCRSCKKKAEKEMRKLAKKI